MFVKTTATGDAATKPEHAGSTNAPDSTESIPWPTSKWAAAVLGLRTRGKGDERKSREARDGCDHGHRYDSYTRTDLEKAICQ